MSSVGNIKKLSGSKFVSLYEFEAVHRDGKISPYYVVSRNVHSNQLKAVTHINNPDGVVVFSVFEGKVVLIRQYRYPVGDYVYEFPAGLVEAGECVKDAAVREMYEETGLHFKPIESKYYDRPFYTTVGLTDESCSTVFGYCEGTPSSINQEASEDIQVILADRDECRRILKEENVALMCAYMLMHYISNYNNPFGFVEEG